MCYLGVFHGSRQLNKLILDDYAIISLMFVTRRKLRIELDLRTSNIQTFLLMRVKFTS